MASLFSEFPDEWLDQLIECFNPNFYHVNFDKNEHQKTRLGYFIFKSKTRMKNTKNVSMSIQKRPFGNPIPRDVLTKTAEDAREFIQGKLMERVYNEQLKAWIESSWFEIKDIGRKFIWVMLSNRWVLLELKIIMADAIVYINAYTFQNLCQAALESLIFPMIKSMFEQEVLEKLQKKKEFLLLDF